jgi:hypothetical protein
METEVDSQDSGRDTLKEWNAKRERKREQRGGRRARLERGSFYGTSSSSHLRDSFGLTIPLLIYVFRTRRKMTAPVRF